MNPKGPGAKTLTLPIVAAVAFLLWLWVGKNAACQPKVAVDSAGGNGLMRLPFEPRKDPPAYPVAEAVAEEELPEGDLLDWGPTTRVAGSFGADPNYHPPPYVSPPLERIHPPPGYMVYSGFVIDGSTFEPIMGAHIHIETEQGRYGSSAISTGEFAVLAEDAPASCEISAKGYFSSRFENANSMQFGTIALLPIRGEFVLDIVDRDGKRIPDCTITILDLSDSPITMPTSSSFDYGLPDDRTQIPVRNSKARIAGLDPGPYKISMRHGELSTIVANFKIPYDVGGQWRLQLDLSLAEIQRNKDPRLEEGADR